MVDYYELIVSSISEKVSAAGNYTVRFVPTDGVRFKAFMAKDLVETSNIRAGVTLQVEQVEAWKELEYTFVNSKTGITETYTVPEQKINTGGDIKVIQPVYKPLKKHTVVNA